MDPTDVQKHLIGVLTQIQSLSGEACPTLDSTVKPIEQLPKFNSKVWPVAAGMLAAAIGKSIPPEMNIFVDDNTKDALTIEQIVLKVCVFIQHLDKIQTAIAA